MTKANPTVVGGFVVGAIALMIAGVVFFGSSSMFSPKVPVVMYFPGSVEGLNTGSVIEFSGVKLGTVTGVTAVVQDDLSIQVVVDGQIDPHSFALGKGVAMPTTPGENFEKFIEKGLRAQLSTGSLLTGQKIISLVFMADKPAVMRGPKEGEYEIPTIPSDFDVYKAEIADTLAKIQALPLEQLVASMLTTVDKFGTTADTANDLMLTVKDDTASVLARVDAMLDQAEELGLVKNTNSAVVDLSALASDANVSIEELTGLSKQAIASFEQSSRALQEALARATSALAEAEGLLSPDSEMSRATLATLNDVSVAVRDIGMTANSIRVLTDYLARNPDSILFGKPAE